MAPENFFCHGTLKAEVAGVLHSWIKKRRLGYLVIDCTRISSVPADLSAEPDVVFISHESLADGRVRLVPSAAGQPGRYVEVEGGPDLIVEIVSDSSVAKDTRRLPKAYFKAGVREFWLADARREPARLPRPLPRQVRLPRGGTRRQGLSAIGGLGPSFSPRRPPRRARALGLRPGAFAVAIS